MEIETPKQLEEFLASIVVNRGDFTPSQVLRALAKVCKSNAEDPNMNYIAWSRTAQILADTAYDII